MFCLCNTPALASLIEATCHKKNCLAIEPGLMENCKNGGTVKISMNEVSSDVSCWKRIWPSNTKEQNRAFRNYCLATVRAIRQRDWQAFRKYCVRDLLLSQYVRVYRDDYSEEQLRNRAFPAIIFTEKDLRAWGRIAGSTRGFYTAILTSVDTSKPLERWNEQVFNQLSKFVQEVSNAQIFFSTNETMLELPELPSGPAIGGKWASNIEWRFQLQEQGKTWLINQIIVAAH